MSPLNWFPSKNEAVSSIKTRKVHVPPHCTADIKHFISLCWKIVQSVQARIALVLPKIEQRTNKLENHYLSLKKKHDISCHHFHCWLAQKIILMARKRSISLGLCNMSQLCFTSKNSNTLACVLLVQCRNNMNQNIWNLWFYFNLEEKLVSSWGSCFWNVLKKKNTAQQEGDLLPINL